MNNVKQVLIVRKDLNMRRGKQIAQGSHASWDSFKLFSSFDYENNRYIIQLPEGELGEEMKDWLIGDLRKKIVLGAESLSELVNVYQSARAAGLPCSLIEDKGLTEFGGVVTITAASIGPAEADKIDPFTKHLNLL